MLHDGWFWLSMILGAIVLTVILLLAWAIRSVRREQREEARRLREAPKEDPSFTVDCSIKPEDGAVKLSFARRVVSVTVEPDTARFMAKKMHEAADVVDHVEGVEREQRPTSWDRIKDD
jgi:hypothetical protein